MRLNYVAMFSLTVILTNLKGDRFSKRDNIRLGAVDKASGSGSAMVFGPGAGATLVRFAEQSWASGFW
ncbi:MAG TPA: hypothetical protein VFL97_02780 [Nitrococcus sp.]|nr:hypothetical protein [Nitrococcus sp.]